MILFYVLTFAVFALGCLALYWADKKWIKNDNAKWWLVKGVALTMSVVCALRMLSQEVALVNTIGLNIHSPFGVNGVLLTAFSMIMIWLTFTSHTLLVTYPFCRNRVKALTPLVKYFASAVFLVNFATMNIQVKALGGADALSSVAMQSVCFAIEVGLGLILCAWTWLKNPKAKYDLTTVKNCVLIALAMIAVSVPTYAFKVLFGLAPNSAVLDELTFTHRVVLYGAFVAPFVIGLLLCRFDYEHKHYALLYMSLATMITFCYRYSFANFSDMSSWPLHLCNTAMFIIPLCLVFKLNKVFYFTLFINVLGAFLAMLMPNTGDGTNLFHEYCFTFWINHYIAFFMPVLMVMLGLYERPRMKLFIYSLIGFACYFVLVLVVNAYLTNTNPGVDFFFVNSDFVADKLGKWAEDTRLITAVIPLKNGMKMVFYPLYQSAFFLVYVVLSFAMWFLYELIFTVQDLYVDIFQRSKKIKADRLAVEVSLAGRNISEPLNMEGTNKLILRNFSKKYSTSDVYAVHEANLEIEGGQIFGFLGPNGAGKSTIIKSIVGIQPITSGSIEVCGYDVEKQSVGAKLQTGFVPDHYALYENLTGREYVNYIADLYNVSKEDRNARIEEFVERFCLQGSFDNPIKTYSHGMKQKITIMSALVHNPKLWILDEPLTGLDPESIFQVKEAMKAHAAAGNIVFFSSHIIDVVERICDRIAIIKKGHILAQRSVKELEEQGIQLESYYMNMIENTKADATPVSAVEAEAVEA